MKPINKNTISIIEKQISHERYLLISHTFKFVDMYILTPWFLLAHSYVCGLEIFSLASFVCLWFVAKGHYQRIANVDLFVINMPSSWRENAAIRLRIIYIIKQSLRSHLSTLVKVRWFNSDRVVFYYINVYIICEIINWKSNIYS